MNSKKAVVILACALVCAGCSSDDPWESPSIGLIGDDGATLFYIAPQNDAGVVFFRAGQLNVSDSNSSNPKERTFKYSGTLTAPDEGIQVAYQFSSKDPLIILIDGAVYNLAQGGVFLITEQGAVEQLPFNPLPPSKDYADLLGEYLRATESHDEAGG